MLVELGIQTELLPSMLKTIMGRYAEKELLHG
jgi:hypothetical protein